MATPQDADGNGYVRSILHCLCRSHRVHHTVTVPTCAGTAVSTIVRICCNLACFLTGRLTPPTAVLQNLLALLPLRSWAMTGVYLTRIPVDYPPDSSFSKTWTWSDLYAPLSRGNITVGLMIMLPTAFPESTGSPILLVPLAGLPLLP